MAGGRRFLACEVALLVLARVSSANAAEVAWQAPAECSDPRQTLEETERLLGSPLHDVDTLDFEVSIAQDGPQRWALKLTTVDRRTRERRARSLSGASCDEVMSAAAVAMAMVVNATTPGPTGESAPEGGPETPAPAVPASLPPPDKSSPARVARPAPRPQRFSGAVALGATVDAGSLPGISPGAELAASLRRGTLQVILLGALYLGGDHVVQGEKGARFELGVAGLLGCGRWSWGPGRGFFCVGGELGQLKGTGVGLKSPRTDETFWWAPRAEAGLAWPLGARWSVSGRAGLVLPQTRPEFVVDRDLFVHRPGRFVGRLQLGMELSLE
jgi:hypothetical protein